MNKQQVLDRLNPLFLQGIAHRGLHDKEGKIPENSIAAFRLAMENNLPIELDVHLTLDKKLVVFHDSDMKRMTGMNGIIENLTVEDLKSFHLPNGETPPLFETVLEMIDEKVPLVIELKVYKRNYRKLAKAVMEMLNKHVKDPKNYMLISFDPRSLWPLKKLGIIRSLLVSYLKENRYVYRYRHTVESVDLDYNFFQREKYQRYVRKHFVNAWTVEDKETLTWIHPYVDTVTFQYIDKETVKEVLNFSKVIRGRGREYYE
ncbi:MAG: hypothetical protein IJQ67_01905 [Bacilli bacterium]|nr:hypothetical protein [Bacilli bacterium]